jgi:long-chain acyl-CoA synthetase
VTLSARSTVLSYLHEHARRGGALVFVHRRGLRTARWSYEQLAQTANRFARELEARGVAPGERVLLSGENSPEWAAAFWGCLLRGAVVVPLDADCTAEFAAAVQRQTAARLVVAAAGTAAAEHRGTPPLRLDQLAEIVGRHAADAYPTPAVNGETVCEIMFTSGTTQVPKGVVLTHRNVLANLLPLEAEIKKYARWARLVRPLRFLNLVPLSHVFGQFMGLFVPQLLGGEVHFRQSLNPAEIARTVRQNRVSVVVLVPRVLELLREWVEREYEARGRADELRARFEAAAGASALRRWWLFRRVHRRFGWKCWAFVSGGATLDERTELFWRRLGFAVLQGYGMTETASLITVTHPFKQRRGSVGKLLPGYEVRLDETGEIMVRGASVSPGYWSEAGGLDARAGEWLATGDLGEMDAAGNIYFKGRKKDVIVTAAGLNVYPEDLEAALNRQPGVRASCVVATEGARGPEPLAVLLLRDAAASAETVVAGANRDLADYQQLRHWVVWPEADFPRTPTHKVIRRAVAAAVAASMQVKGVRAREETGSARGGAPAPDRSTASVIIAEASRISGSAPQPGQLDAAANLTTSLKLDSLGRVELLSALEDRYGVELDETAFTAATTVGDVERLVRGEADEPGAPYPYPRWPRRFPVTWLRALLFYTIILPLTLVMSRLRVAGRAHVESLNEPVLYVANHVSLADQALVLAALPARLRPRLAIAMDGERLRGWLHPPAGTGRLTRLRLLAQYVLVVTFFQVFPLPKQSGFRQGFAYAGACVDRGESVLIFPEGERAPRGQMQMGRFKSGIGLLARGLGVPVVPVKLDGLYELKRQGRRFAGPGMIRVVFGPPVRFAPERAPAEIAEELARRVAAL